MNDDFNNYVKDYSLTDKQEVVVERYLKSTESFKAERMPLLKLLSMKNNISKTNTIPVLPESDVDVRIPSKKTRLKVVDNLLVKNFLLEYDEYKDMSEEHYWTDDIFTGCTRLDLGGNTRDLSKYLMFSILKEYEAITSKIIEEHCNVKERQAQNIVKCLNIISCMLRKEIINRKLIKE